MILIMFTLSILRLLFTLLLSSNPTSEYELIGYHKEFPLFYNSSSKGIYLFNDSLVHYFTHDSSLSLIQMNNGLCLFVNINNRDEK